MPREGPACETYAVVGRPKSGAGPVLVPPKASPPPARPAAGCEYENLDQAGEPARDALLYSTVIVKAAPRRPRQHGHPEASPKAKEPHGSPPANSYAAIAFGQACPDPRGSPSPATGSDVASEYWAPSLPKRTADSYVVLDADESEASSYSSSHENNRRSSNLINAFKMLPLLQTIVMKMFLAPLLSSPDSAHPMDSVLIPGSPSRRGLGLALRPGLCMGSEGEREPRLQAEMVRGRKREHDVTMGALQLWGWDRGAGVGGECF
ncbi:uncharacterized protein LOC144677789 isoform X1 [Cetorhinus maximus]